MDDSRDSAARAAIAWLRRTYSVERASVVERRPVHGGVSGATIERLSLRMDRSVASVEPTVIDVVVKHPSRTEVDALRLLAPLNEPMIPRLLASGVDDAGPWILLPWLAGRPVGLTADLPRPIGRLMARIHHRFIDARDEWPTTLRPVDADYVREALNEYLPSTLTLETADPAYRPFRTRALALADQVVNDAPFLAASTGFPATVVHGDLYGLNVLIADRPGSQAPPLSVIDWDSTRTGPGMLDVAMSTASLASPFAQAYTGEWRRLGGRPRDADVEFAWASTLINVEFCGTVAQRADLQEAIRMLDTASRAFRRFCLA